MAVETQWASREELQALRAAQAEDSVPRRLSERELGRLPGRADAEGGASSD